ncbi:hypothetical protein WR25_05234 [Diploscapter pachys]|uniref:Cytochrome b5 heme-binding domain-containing protein n=1 Tax=Diploscapter pachys TaxID=2018661 RepID=A0A2A2L8I3_9BILA|nr:hypothetical protein WR25_05234 [Diploscapter pachys]
MGRTTTPNDKAMPILLQYKGKRYDVTEFAKKHPGGEKVLRALAGEDVEEFMKGQQRILGSDPKLNSKKGVLWKIPELRHEYWTWIHQPYEGTIRLFDSDFLESLTRTVWYIVPLVWLPVVALFSFLAFSKFYHSYGLHHKTPMDPHRQVFPPVPAALVAGFFYVLYVNIFSWPVFCAFVSGKLFGYVCYDMIHLYLHYGQPKVHSNMHVRKIDHYNHHFKDYDTSYGISTSLWDYVFEAVGMGPL